MARSRFSKRQQQKIVRQSIFFMALAIAILAAFIFYAVPNFIYLTDVIFNSSSSNNQSQDQVPPPAPVLAAPVAATNSATLPISGVGEVKSEVILIINGRSLEEVEINADGKFEFKVPLTEGENKLTVYSRDEAGNESVKTKEYLIELDTRAPQIEIEYPDDGAQIELRKNQVIIIQGQTEPRARVFINDRLVYAREDGSFLMNYQLAEGENAIKFKVIDRGGNESQNEIKVKFRY